MADLQILGIPANYPSPGVFVQVNFAQGAAAAGTSNYSVIMIGNLLSTGSAQVDGYVYGPDTFVTMQSVDDAIALFGAGSELMRMVRDFLRVNKTTSLYCAPVKESTGVQATLAITFTGTATSPGTVRVFTPDGPVDTGFSNGDTAATLGANIVTNINAQSNLPFTASGTGTVTLTSKQKGLRGNWLRSSALVLSGTGLTSGVTKQTYFTGGTVADSNTNVLNFLAGNGQRYYYQVSAAEDATQFGALATQMGTLAQPSVGLRQRCLAGSVDTLANVDTIATGINNARSEVVWSQNNDVPPSELAANAAAVYSLFETYPLSANQSVNFDFFGNDAVSSQFWLIKSPLDGTAPTTSNINTAILNGVSPINVQRAGRTALVKRVTTRSLNGAVNDYRIADSGKVTICDYFSDDLYSILVQQYARKVIGNDPPQGQPYPAQGVVTPSMVRGTCINLINQYSNNGLINGASVIAGLEVFRGTTPTSRMNILVPLFTADPLHQFGVLVNQVG